MSNLSLIKFAYNWEYPHLLLDVVYRDYPLGEIESGLNHMPRDIQAAFMSKMRLLFKI